MKGEVLENQSVINTTVLVDSGIYSVIRHPQYLCFMMWVFPFVLMSQHWLSIISGVTELILFYLDVLKEEEANVEKFGEAYIRYMQRVPRINIVLGPIRVLLHRKEVT